MPDLRDIMKLQRIMSAILAISSFIMATLTMLDYNTPQYWAGMSLVTYIIALTGFGLFLNTRSSWLLFWIIACAGISVGVGFIFTVIGFNGAVADMHDLSAWGMVAQFIGQWFSNFVRTTTFSIVLTQFVGALAGVLLKDEV